MLRWRSFVTRRWSSSASATAKIPRQIGLPPTMDHLVRSVIDASDTTLRELRMDALRIMDVDLNQTPSENDTKVLRWKMELQKKQLIMQYSDRETLAYLAVMLSRNYAMVHRVLTELSHQRPGFQPKSMLDFGTGPGTAIWYDNTAYEDHECRRSANELWNAYLERVLAVDVSESMIAMAEKLIRHPLDFEDDVTDLRRPDANIVKYQRYLSPTSSKRYDIVVAASVLSELPSDAIRAMMIRTLWQKTAKYLVLVENGNEEGYRTIVNARHLVLLDENKGLSAVNVEDRAGGDVNGAKFDHSAHVVAPCPHDGACPWVDHKKNWCHFMQQFSRNNHMIQVKKSKTDFENARYSYVILEKGPREQVTTQARILPNISKSKKLVLFDLCQPDGQACSHRVTKTKNPERYKEARKARSGQLWDLNEKNDKIE